MKAIVILLTLLVIGITVSLTGSIAIDTEGIDKVELDTGFEVTMDAENKTVYAQNTINHDNVGDMWEAGIIGSLVGFVIGLITAAAIILT